MVRIDISQDWCMNMAKIEDGEIGAGSLAPYEAAEAKFDAYESYPAKFGAATAEIVRLQRHIEDAERSLKAIRDSQWSGNLCRDYADAALENLARSYK